MPAFPTTCPFCSCGCGLYLFTNEKQLVGVGPGESHPVSSGKLCARGWSAHEAALWGKRLRQPLLRKNGERKPVSWDEALDHITQRFNELIEAGKSLGVLGSARATNEENYLAGKLARAGLHTNNLDFSYDALCGPFLTGLEEVCGQHIPTVTLKDIAANQAIFLLEGNLAQTHPRAASLIREAVAKGAFLVTIGYRITQMARLSSLHLESTPGNELEVIRGLLASVLELHRIERKQDTDGVCGTDYDALWGDVENVKRTSEMWRAAEQFVRAERAAFLVGCTAGNGDHVRRDAAAVATLAAATGHLGRHGSGLLPLVARSNVRGAWDMGVTPGRLPGYRKLGDEESRRLQQLWGNLLPLDRGSSAEEMLQSVSGLIVLADDPPSVVPMGEKAKSAMEKMEILVVLDAFDTPTVQIAHAVLPIASFAETEGTVTNMEGRVQRVCAAVNPPGEARVGWRVLADLCARFGAGKSYTSARDVLSEIGLAAPRYAGIEQRLSESGWNGVLLDNSESAEFAAHSNKIATMTEPSFTGRPYMLVRDGSFDWERDPLAAFSPTLSRDAQSERKLFPSGYVEMAEWDASALNLGGGRRVRLVSDHGQVVVPIRLRTDLKPGVLSTPYAYRDQLSAVMGTEAVTGVHVELP